MYNLKNRRNGKKIVGEKEEEGGGQNDTEFPKVGDAQSTGWLGSEGYLYKRRYLFLAYAFFVYWGREDLQGNCKRARRRLRYVRA